MQAIVGLRRPLTVTRRGDVADKTSVRMRFSKVWPSAHALVTGLQVSWHLNA